MNFDVVFPLLYVSLFIYFNVHAQSKEGEK